MNSCRQNSHYKRGKWRIIAHFFKCLYKKFKSELKLENELQFLKGKLPSISSNFSNGSHGLASTEWMKKFQKKIYYEVILQNLNTYYCTIFSFLTFCERAWPLTIEKFQYFITKEKSEFFFAVFCVIYSTLENFYLVVKISHLAILIKIWVVGILVRRRKKI